MSTDTWTWQEFSKGLAALRHSRTFRQGANNAAYSIGDYFAQSLLMVATAPFFVARLGLEQYGIWMLVSALAGTMAIFGMGLGDATIRFVSAYRGRNDPAGMVRIVRGSLTINALLSGLMAGVAFLAAPVLVRHVFKIQPEHYTIAIRAIQVGSLVLLLRSIDSVFASTLRACEQYAPSAKLAVLVKVAIVGAALVLVYLGGDVVSIMLATAAATALGAVLQALAARHVLAGISCRPTVDRATWREIFSFSSYTWMQSAAAVVFSQVDRLLVAGFLGTAAVAYYTLCTQLAQIVHALPAAAFNFLFPHISARHAAGDRKGSRRVFLLAVLVNIALAAALCLPLVFWGNMILTLWMGAGFAQKSHLLAVLAISFGILSINVVPHYTLLGLGKVRFVSTVNIVGGVLSLISALVLIPFLGLIGAAVGRLLYGPVVSLNYAKVAKSL